MADVDLVITDLDGSLWSGHEVLHPATIAAWRELERRGIEVMVATGRRLRSARDPLARHGIVPAAVLLNGALVLDLATGERYHHHAHERAAARTVLDAFRAVDVEPCVYVDDPECAVLVGKRVSTHPDHLRALAPEARVVDLEEHVEDATVLMFGVVGHAVGPLRTIAAATASVAEPHVTPRDQWGGASCTVTPRGLSKWVGVLAYCEARGIDATRTLALGDGPNDVELLAGAAVAVVPTDGRPEALAVADHVVPSPAVGGWAAILDLV